MSSIQTGHPLPAPPGQARQVQPQRGHSRPRSKSTFSFRSDKSHKSSGSTGKIDLHESHQEKEARRLTSKADPMVAMNEAEPTAVASNTSSQLAPLRAIQHRDANGNPIADPDRSNPTRSRWERPLDTIRSFEAAIDGNYSRKSFMRTESSSSVAGMNRRSSYYPGSNVGAMNQRNQDSYYGGRPQSYRPDSYYEGNGNNVNNNNFGNTGPSNGYVPSRARYPRTASEPAFNNGTGVYPVNGQQRSYETVTTASGSGSSADAAGYSTDPSSENSSLDRTQAMQKPDQIDSYGFNGFDNPQRPQMNNSAYNSYSGYPGNQAEMPQTNGYQGQTNGPLPPVPRKEIRGPPRVPIKLGASTGGDSPGYYEAPRPVNEKRKSWFGKRFSKA